MKLLRLHADKRNVVAVLVDKSNASAECPLLNFLNGQPKNLASSAKGFKALFARYAKYGRNGVTTSSFHEANKQDGIWRFRKGDLRVYCYMDNDEHLLIISHGMIKKGRKSDKADVVQAVRHRNKYHEAKKAKQMTFLDLADFLKENKRHEY